MLEKRTRKSEITILSEIRKIISFTIQKITSKLELLFLIIVFLIFNLSITQKIRDSSINYVFHIYKKFEYNLDHSIGNIIIFCQDYLFLKEKYDELLEENKKLKELHIKSQNLEFENEKLQKLLFFVTSHKLNIISTRLLWGGDDASDIIELGEKDGISSGELVISENGVIGRVYNVFQDFSTLKPIFSENNFPVFIVRTGHKFMVSGTAKRNLLKILFFEKQNKLREGDQVVTYGIKGKIPDGVYVGKIVKIDDEFYVSSKIKWSKLHFVSIITNSAKHIPTDIEKHN